MAEGSERPDQTAEARTPIVRSGRLSLSLILAPKPTLPQSEQPSPSNLSGGGRTHGLLLQSSSHRDHHPHTNSRREVSKPTSVYSRSPMEETCNNAGHDAHV